MASPLEEATEVFSSDSNEPANVEATVLETAGMLGDATTMLLSALVPLLIAIFLLCRSRSQTAGRRKLVIFGPVGGGKTTLLHQLRYGRVVPTVSSMVPTVASFTPAGQEGSARTATIVDVPGSGRLRQQLLEEASDASALLCVIDGTQLISQAREAAGMLFEILAHEPVVRRRLPLMIAVNKTDCPGSATCLAARKAIEQELHRVRLARTTMEDTSGAFTQSGIAADQDGQFSFDNLVTNTTTFVTVSAAKGELAVVVDLVRSLR